MRLFGRAPGGQPLPGHGDVAVLPASRRGLTAGPASSSARAVALGAGVGSGGPAERRDGPSSGVVRPCCQVRRRRSCSARSPSSASGTGPASRCRVRVRHTFFHLDHDRGGLNQPVYLGARRGWFTTEPFSEARGLHLPGRHGPGGGVSGARRGALIAALGRGAEGVTFKYGRARSIGVMRTLERARLDKTDQRNWAGALSPVRGGRCLPDRRPGRTR